MPQGDLTTLDAVRAWLDLPAGPSDTLLASLITQISAYVPNVIQRGILTTTYSETRTGNGKSRMQLLQWPVQAIAAVEWDGTRITTAVGLFDDGPGIATDGRSLVLRGYRLPCGAPVRISYTAGWDEVPADIQLAVTELVGEAYTRRTHIGEISHAAGGQVTVAFEVRAMHAAIQDRLSNYMAVAPLC